jgi:hypothetical protein
MVKVSIDMSGGQNQFTPIGRAPNPVGRSAPSSVNSFDCFVVNVYGSQIPAVGNYVVSGGCSYPGILSTLIPPTQTTVSLQLPSGSSRTFQMIGVSTGGAGCGTATSVAALSSPSLYVLGQTTVDLFADTQLSIQDTYAQATATTPYTCPLSTTSSGLTLVAGLTGSNYGNSTTPAALPVSSSVNSISAIPAATLASLSSTSNSSALYASGTSQVPRADFVFSLDGATLSNYSKIRIVALIGGGSSVNSSNPGVLISVWQGLAWSAATATNTAQAYTSSTLTPSDFTVLDQTLSISPSSAALATGSTYLTGLPTTLTTSQNLYLSVVTNSSPQGPMAIGVLYIQAYLVP